MSLYSLLRPLLFKLDAERAHYLTLQSLQCLSQLKLLHYPQFKNERAIMGIHFPNPVGLAAGLDKNADYVDALSKLGFGFIEIGTVTPRPQPGNEKPRLFRLLKDEAIINRLGFNNKGMDYVAKRLAQTNYHGVLGINIGKNRDTSNENAIHDYVACFRKLALFASYITINISSPNTPGLRELQQNDALNQLLQALKNEQKIHAINAKKYVPIVVKISPDLTDDQVQALAHICLEHNIDGVIATNTSINCRDNLREIEWANENGGLSGRPLNAKSTHIIEVLHAIFKNRMPIIAVGGIMDAESAKAKYAAGASLLQVYTGLIYRGPNIIQEIAKLP